MASRKPRRKKRITGRKKSAVKRSRQRPVKTKGRKKPPRKRSVPRKKRLPRKKTVPAMKPPLGAPDFDIAAPLETRGLGLEAGGQAGDTEGLSRAELADSESVEELVEEGQAFEAGVVSGVEDAPEADQGEVTTREVPEDDVPQEYLDKD